MLTRTVTLWMGLSMVFTLAGCATNGVSQAELGQVRPLAQVIEIKKMDADFWDDMQEG